VDDHSTSDSSHAETGLPEPTTVTSRDRSPSRTFTSVQTVTSSQMFNITQTVPIPNGAPITLVSPSSPTSSSGSARQTNTASGISHAPSGHFREIIIPVILGATLILGLLSFLFVRYKRRARRARSATPQAAMSIKSWNSVSWPGFDRLLNKTSLVSHKSSLQHENLEPNPDELEAGTVARDSRVTSKSGTDKSKITQSSSIIWDNNKRMHSSQFSIVTLPPDS
jgi:hypothetical protein